MYFILDILWYFVSDYKNGFNFDDSIVKVRTYGPKVPFSPRGQWLVILKHIY